MGRSISKVEIHRSKALTFVKHLLVDAVGNLSRVKWALTHQNFRDRAAWEPSEREGTLLFPSSLDKTPKSQDISPNCLSQDGMTASGHGC